MVPDDRDAQDEPDRAAVPPAEDARAASRRDRPASGARLLHRPRLSAQDRGAAMEALMLHPSVAALRRFAALMVLSVLVASVGLLQNSTAVVVGAMMIAPLMAPIMGMAASIVMGWGARLLRGAAVVAVAVAGAVAMSWVIALFLPAAGSGLPAEVLARSNPDVRDLLVALAAGAAGAYATVRKDVSGALPGVAVAVALVPPLACVGILLGRHQPDLARGAGLLFATNLFGIVLAAAVVFTLTGFVQLREVRRSRSRALATVAVLTIPPLAVGVVLTSRFLHTADHARNLRLAIQAVQDWLGPGDELDRVTLSGSTLQVNAAGVGEPPAVQTLTDALREQLGRTTAVDLRWTPVRDGTPPPTGPTLALDQVRPVVELWLSGQALTLEGLSYDSSALVVRTSGTRPPEAADELAALIETEFGARPPVSLVWTRAAPEAPATAGPDASVLTARAAADTWARAHPGTAVLAVDQAGDTVTVTIIGAAEPAVADLNADLAAALPKMNITVQWVPGSILSHSEPTPSPAASPPAEPSPSGTARPSAAPR